MFRYGGQGGDKEGTRRGKGGDKEGTRRGRGGGLQKMPKKDTEIKKEKRSEHGALMYEGWRAIL